MAELSPLGVLHAALPRILEAAPKAPSVLLLRAIPGIVRALPSEATCRGEQGFLPLHAALQGEGVDVADGVGAPVAASARAGLVVVLPPRSRDEGRALLARAVREVAVGGVVAGAALNDEGARSFEKDLALLLPLSGQISKAHGRAFWTIPRPESLPDDTVTLAERWISADAPRLDAASGLWQRPGVFNEGRLDAGSSLLIQHLPETLHGAVADFGAGTGLLSMAVLERCPKVASVDLFEAEARALDLARRNLAEARVPVRFHWQDVARGVTGRFDAIVCNPPFHVGSRGVPALGRAFIAAAAASLSREGPLLLVANRHLPYEDALREAFGRGELLAEQGGFKVYRAWSPRS